MAKTTGHKETMWLRLGTPEHSYPQLVRSSAGRLMTVVEEQVDSPLANSRTRFGGVKSKGTVSGRH